MQLRFSKMHGLGNDFMVIDLVTQRARLSNDQIRRLADRHLGVGFDQLLLVEPPTRPDMDFRYRIFNADGGEVENCGNGARCFARFVYDQQLTPKQDIHVETGADPLTLHIASDGNITVDMGEPILDASRVPFTSTSGERQPVHRLHLESLPEALANVEFGVVSMGNPHAVLRVENVASAPVEQLGPVLERHPSFPQRVNVGFMQIKNRTHICLRVFERGVGETQACGTGACAAVVSGIQRGLLEERVHVELPGGSLRIEWAGEGHHLYMTGPAVTVFEGKLAL
ncbi:diaminopimelate epimerase [Carnimonas nigrificans]|uniref:diaminopimelate epimerase n=1 Tax=Carnimonas nigrificans TaxID=64323 RepID=UPI00047171DA|nr:diaminopimelate epimerase [Carnimonas nigrificans]